MYAGLMVNAPIRIITPKTAMMTITPKLKAISNLLGIRLWCELSLSGISMIDSPFPLRGATGSR